MPKVGRYTGPSHSQIEIADTQVTLPKTDLQLAGDDSDLTVGGSVTAVGGVRVGPLAGPLDQITHRWETDGFTPFTTRFVATRDGSQVYTPSVTGRRGRVTASADTSGNHREWFLHSGTAGWDDVEVSGVLWPPSNWDASPINRPQHGFVLRAQQVPGVAGTWRAFVAWFDIAFGTSGMLANTWQADGTTLTQGSGATFTAPSLTVVQRTMRVLRAARIDAFDVAQYWVTPIHTYSLANGDLVTVAGMVDSSFNRTSVAASNVASGFFQLSDTTANSNVDGASGVGTVDFVGVNRTVYPRAFAARLVGSTLSAKFWSPEDPEPDWGSAAAATLTAPSSPALPTGAGLAGVLCGHAHTGSYLEYGDLTFRRL